MAKKILVEWGIRIFLLSISLAFSLLLIEFILCRCFGNAIESKINPEPYEFTIDNHGFRINSRDKTYSTAAGEYCRIICLGDSFTFGHGVSDEESYPFLLEQRLNNSFGKKTQVINAGVCGATINGELKMYVDNCVNFQHRLVLLLYYTDDVNQILGNELKGDIIDALNHYIGKNIQETKIMRLILYLHEKWKWMMIGKKIEAMESKDPVYDKYFGYLKELDKRARLENARLAVIFYQPEEKIINFCLNNGISVIDVTEEYDKQKKIENLLLICHHNKRGNEFLARQISDKLINADLLDRDDIYIRKNPCLTAKRLKN